MKSIEDVSPMRRQVYSLPELIRGRFWELENQARTVLTTPEIFAARRIVIVGSGDSHIAGMAAELCFFEFAQIGTCVHSSMHASRYVAPFLVNEAPNTPLVLAVSNSGEVARVVEAVEAFNACGALTIAVTANRQSRLGLTAKKTLDVSAPAFDSSPGVRSFAMSLLALQLLAIRIAEVRGRMTMDQAMALRNELAASADAIEQTLSTVDDPCQNLAKEWRQLENFEFIGSGPCYGMAAFGAAKLLEAVGSHALYDDTEEWNHLHYFVSSPATTGTLVLAHRSARSLSRTQETMSYLANLERPYVVVDNMESSASNVISHSLPIHCPQREALSPIVYIAPLALFAAYLNEEMGAAYGRYPDQRWRDSWDGAAVRGSVIETSKSDGSHEDSNSER